MLKFSDELRKVLLDEVNAKYEEMKKIEKEMQQCEKRIYELKVLRSEISSFVTSTSDSFNFEEKCVYDSDGNRQVDAFGNVKTEYVMCPYKD